MTANRIVIIEDDPAILDGLAESLRLESYEVQTAADGSEGYRMARDNPPDLIILDLMLPGMNGFDVCRRIRSHGMVTPILMLTAQDQETQRVQGFEAGADDYVTKPFSLRELLGRVRAILRRSEGRSDVANQKELDEARQIQQRLMPAAIPQIPGLQVAAIWRPARIVGGDYFDVLKLNESTVAVCIADVCGKGMPAAMVMSNLQAVVKACVSTRRRPAEVCAEVNRVMCANMAGQGFISLFYAVIDVARAQITYCNAGHNPPVLARDSESSRLCEGGGVLGVFPDWKYQDEKVRFQSGDKFLFFTDGITESRDASGEEFGDGRLIDVAAGAGTNNAATLADAAIAAAAQFSNGQFEDDLTVIAVTVER